jgi:chromate transporter
VQTLDQDGPLERVPFSEAFRYWLKLGFINFGGPAGQIAIMHSELVDRRKWIGDDRFLHALNYCMLLPGPEAQQLAIYIGWLLHRAVGGIVAGVLFVLPGFFFMLGLAWLYAVHGDVTWVAAVFFGLRAAVVAIVISALLRVGKKALKDRTMVAIAGLAFVAIFVVSVPFPLIILGAGLSGLWRSVRRPEPSTERDHDNEAADRLPSPIAPSARRTWTVLSIGLLVWWAPLLTVALIRGGDDVLTQEAFFFSKAALVTFGGAYAVLSYINQAAVERFGWLEPGQMVTGLGLAESTPGPLILVTQFVGFLAAYQDPGTMSPLTAGILGASVAVWATFAPCFLWIFLGAPYIEKLRGNKKLSGALSAITAAVVGVIFNLAVWFSVHALFTRVTDTPFLLGWVPIPDPASLDLFALSIAGVALYGLLRYRWNVVAVVGASAIAGLIGKGLF